MEEGKGRKGRRERKKRRKGKEEKDGREKREGRKGRESKEGRVIKGKGGRKTKYREECKQLPLKQYGVQ